MKKQLLFTITAALIFVGCLPTAYGPFMETSKKFEGRYTSHLEADESVVNSWYHYITSKNAQGEYIIRTFYPEINQITSMSTYRSKQGTAKHGLSKEWYDDGTLMSEGYFVNGRRDGEWIIGTGGETSVIDKGRFVFNEKSGVWKTYRDEDELVREVNYIEGLKEGAFVEYDSMGVITNEGIYKADTIFQQTKDIEDVVEQMPAFSDCSHLENKEDRKACTDKDMLMFIYKNIRYPAVAREYGVQGSALVSFVVNKDGSISDIVVKRGICQSIANEVKAIVEKMPNWHLAGIQDGEKVKVQFNLPIKFKLQ